MAKIATEDKTVHDDVLGIDRRVFAGTEIPPDLEEAYEEAGGGTTDREPAPSGVVIATSDLVVHDEALEIDRKIIAGQPVPPDLLDAYAEQTGDDVSATAEEPSVAVASYDDQSVDELQAEADRRGLEVEGTGKDGNVLKADLIAALTDDEKGA